MLIYFDSLAFHLENHLKEKSKKYRQRFMYKYVVKKQNNIRSLKNKFWNIQKIDGYAVFIICMSEIFSMTW